MGETSEKNIPTETKFLGVALGSREENDGMRWHTAFLY